MRDVPAATHVPWPRGVGLARAVEGLPEPRALPGGCLYEPKWDGYRALVASWGGRGWVRSRRGVDLTSAFPDIGAAVQAQLPPGSLLDGELVIWDGEKMDFTALQRRVIAPIRARELARNRPASFLAFDILCIAGRDMTTEPLRVRRRRLEQLLPSMSPPLQITPATRDPAMAARWMDDYAAADVGVEGLVIKGLAEPYLPGRRAWMKLKSRSTAEAIVGAVTGTIGAPDRLILGLYDSDGRFVIAGGTAPLKPRQHAEAAFLLRASVGEHPWPDVLPSGRTGVFAADRELPVTLVNPTLVVEVLADSAFEFGRWRHLTRYIRARPDLTRGDLRTP